MLQLAFDFHLTDAEIVAKLRTPYLLNIIQDISGLCVREEIENIATTIETSGAETLTDEMYKTLGNVTFLIHTHIRGTIDDWQEALEAIVQDDWSKLYPVPKKLVEIRDLKNINEVSGLRLHGRIAYFKDGQEKNIGCISLIEVQNGVWEIIDLQADYIPSEEIEDFSEVDEAIIEAILVWAKAQGRDKLKTLLIRDSIEFIDRFRPCKLFVLHVMWTKNIPESIRPDFGYLSFELPR